MSNERNDQCSTTVIEHRHPTTTSGSTLAPSDTESNVLTGVRTAIHRLSGPNATAEDFLTVQHVVAGMKQVMRDYDQLAKEASLEFINEHGPVETETERYYVGSKKTTKCRDTGKTLEAILTETGGDFGAAVELMASEPFKPGACKGVLGDSWERCFIVNETPDLKTGKPKKEVKRIDKRFEKGRK